MTKNFRIKKILIFLLSAFKTISLKFERFFKDNARRHTNDLIRQKLKELNIVIYINVKCFTLLINHCDILFVRPLDKLRLHGLEALNNENKKN